MQYVEMLRARRHLIWFAAIFASSFILTAITALTHHITLDHGEPGDIPIQYLLGICYFGALIVASFLAPGLHAEHSTLALTWTRPTPRATIAWRFIGVDLGAMLVGALIVGLVVAGQLLVVGILRYVSGSVGDVVVTLVEAAGAAIMWYALVMLAAVRMPERAGMIAGLSWIVFSAISIFVSVDGLWPVVHAIAVGLDYLNPLAYFGSISSGSTMHSDAAGTAVRHSVHIPLIASPVLRTITSYAIGGAALLATVRLWSTREI